MRSPAIRPPPSPVAVRAVDPRRQRRLRRGGWIRRWFARPEPTVYHRCLAIHIHHAGQRSALS